MKIVKTTSTTKRSLKNGFITIIIFVGIFLACAINLKLQAYIAE